MDSKSLREQKNGESGVGNFCHHINQCLPWAHKGRVICAEAGFWLLVVSMQLVNCTTTKVLMIPELQNFIIPDLTMPLFD